MTNAVLNSDICLIKTVLNSENENTFHLILRRMASLPPSPQCD